MNKQGPHWEIIQAMTKIYTVAYKAKPGYGHTHQISYEL